MKNDFSRKYYSNQYTSVNRSGIQGWGNSLVDIYVEKYLDVKSGYRILEIGASSGEHFAFSKRSHLIKEYIGIDLLPGVTNPDLARRLRELDNFKLISGNAENIPFEDQYFDAVISTCVLAHVLHPEKVFEELRRVTKPGGQIIVGMPSDPGALNRLIKFLITYRIIKRSGVTNPKLVYAREHINSVDKLIILANHVFEFDTLKFTFFPFRLKSWNFNLIVFLRVIKGQ